jgi:hypothetical protein
MARFKNQAFREKVSFNEYLQHKKRQLRKKLSI